MTAGAFSNKPKILKGAFVEYGLKLPPKFVVFQFNPEQLSRARSVSYEAPSDNARSNESTGNTSNDQEQSIIGAGMESGSSLRELHKKGADKGDELKYIQDQQQTEFSLHSLSFQIRLDASERLNDGDIISGQYGILPELSALEQMVLPQEEDFLNFDLLKIKETGFTLNESEKPPITLFIWGLTRVMPVNLESLSITETEFNAFLSPTRATVDVSMSAIEGPNIPNMYTQALRSTMAALNLRNVPDLANILVPG